MRKKMPDVIVMDTPLPWSNRMRGEELYEIFELIVRLAGRRRHSWMTVIVLRWNW
jgi:hypothetical protein